jgi:threonine dehydrogenase-like Zn-dependent dehydrogenase
VLKFGPTIARRLRQRRPRPRIRSQRWISIRRSWRWRGPYGADFTFDSRAKDVGEQIQVATGGLVAVVDFVGSGQTSSLALSVLRTDGTYVNVGLFGGLLQEPLALLAQRQLVVRGSYVGTPQDLRGLIGHVRAGKIKPPRCIR